MKLSTIVLLMISGIVVFGQNRGMLRGFVADSTSGEALPYANIYIPEINRGVSTDHRGYFLMASLPHDKPLTVRVSYIGYETKEYLM